jgi:hypothetical protein
MTGCLYDANNQSEADQLVNRYHTLLKAGDVDGILALYNDVFFAEHNRKAWRAALLKQQKEYGVLQQVRQVYTQKDPRFRGDYYIYGYTLVFEHGKVSETITVFKGIEDDTLTIAGHTLKVKKH